MFRHIKDVTALAVAAGTATARIAETYTKELVLLAKDQLPNPQQLTELFEKIGSEYTPIPIAAYCDHRDSDDPDDYYINLDITEIAQALNAGRQARPQLTVHAKYPDDINRDLLAERLETALKPLIKAYQANVTTRKQALRRKAEKDKEVSFFAMMDLGLLILIFPPIILVMLALDFVEGIKQLPKLVTAKLFGDEHSKLDAELEQARSTVRKIVKGLVIKPLP